MYISFDPTDPGTLYGGTWERLKKVFLFAADDDQYTVGSSVTVDEMPSHHHAINLFASTSGRIGTTLRDAQQGKPLSATWQENSETASAENYEQNILYTGGSQPHNNMPPYLAVHAWKRTA